MSETDTRTVYRWSGEQMRAAGWELVTLHGDGFGASVWWKWGEATPQPAEGPGGDIGAWMPELPPEPEMSDEEIRCTIKDLRNGADVAARQGRRGFADAQAWAADALEAMLGWSRACWGRGGDKLKAEMLMEIALRRVPRWAFDRRPR